MDKTAEVAPQADLVLKASRTHLLLLLVAPPLAVVWGVVSKATSGGSAGLAVWILAACLTLLAAAGATLALLPYRLVADRKGLSWTALGRTRMIPWRDIEAIGVARSRAFDGHDRPVVNFLTWTSPARHRARNRPMIGVNYRPGASPQKNAATRAYRTGLTGFEVNLPNVYGVLIEDLVAELSERHRAAG